MRVTFAFLMSGLLGFALAYGLYTVERAANGEPTAWAPPPLRPPPLDLPAAACTQEARNELPGDWTRAAATEHLAREVAAHEQVDLLETWLHEGKLDHVSPGEPTINEEDLRSFLNATIT